MAEKKTIELEIKSNLGDAEKSIGSLKSQLRQAQNEVASLSDKFGATSREAVKAAQKAAELADKIGDAKALTDAFNPDAKFRALSGSLAGVAGGFSAVTGVMGALGTESKDVENAILKVQSAMAISSGLQTLGESVDSFKQLGAVIKSTTIFQQISTQAQRLWNLAMSANPIGAVVLAITALLTAGAALVSWYKSSSDENKKNTQSVKSNSQALENQKRTADKTADSIKKNSDYQLEMAKASGASSEAIRKLELKLIDEKIAYANSSREVAKNTYYKNLNTLASLEASDAEDEVIDAQKETTKKSLEEFGKQTKNLNDANAEKIQIIRKHNVEKKQTETNSNKEILDKNNENSKKEKENAIAKKKEEADALKKIEEDRVAIQMNSAKQAISILDELSKSQETPAQKEEREYQEKLAVLQANNLNTELLTKQHKDNVDKIILDSYAKDADASIKRTADAKANADAQKAIDDKLAEAKVQNMQRGSAMLGQISDLVGKNTAAGKVAAVAAATIDTYASAQSAFKNAQLNPISIIGPAYPYISAGLAIAGGLKNVKSILSVKTPGGGGGGASLPSAASIGSGPTAPAFNVVGASATNQLAQTIGQKEQQPVKAYVVSNDVTTAQSLNRNIISSATLG